MSKPDWKNAPEWANYLVQDLGGQWVWFERLPEPNTHYWCALGKHEVAKLTINRDWHKSLEVRPCSN